MCNVLDLQMQLDKIKDEKQSLTASVNEQRRSKDRAKSIHPDAHPERKELSSTCSQLLKIIEQRNNSR